MKWKIADQAELRVKYGITTVRTMTSWKDSDEIKMQFRVRF
jgi:hypothetical protein